MGSLSPNFCNFPKSQEDYYILGLWCADGYHWTSSIGLTNIDKDLIEKFRKFFNRFFPEKRIKLGKYIEGKRRYVGYKLYVNCRPLLRIFKSFKNSNERIVGSKENVRAYLAGRFDGDGCISRDLKKDCRISYGNLRDAKLDHGLLINIGLKNSKIYKYRTSNTYVNYISQKDTGNFIKALIKQSNKLQKFGLRPRRDLANVNRLA